MAYQAEAQAATAEQVAARLRLGKVHDVAGRLDAAAAAYEEVCVAADLLGEGALQVEALRRLAVIRHRGQRSEQARELCIQSYRRAVSLSDLTLAGEALNSLGGFDFEAGEHTAARSHWLNALALAGASYALRGRIEQNLGILASVEGDHSGAFAHYRRALEAFRIVGDEAGAAIVHHNIGLISSRRCDLEQAEASFMLGAALAFQLGDAHLGGLCELHRAEVALQRRLYSTAIERVEKALSCFEKLGDTRSQSEAYKVLGKILCECGRMALAEERLRTAMSLAVGCGWILGQAEAARELAVLLERNGLKEEAIEQLKLASELYGRLEARVELADVTTRIAELAA